jgi:5,10-methylenetetrahydromethanopterin reductase
LGDAIVLLDIGVTNGIQLKQIFALSKLAEKLDLNCIWIGDDIAEPHDVFTLASIILLKYSNVNVGIGITSPFIRNITTIARASSSLAEIGGKKRFRLGLGIGGLQNLKTLGISVSDPETQLRNAAALLRKIWEGKTLSFEDNFVLKHYYPRYALSDQIPIFLGVRGPKLLKLTGEIADGVILSGPRIYLEKAIAIVKEGFVKSQRARKNFRLVLWVPTILIEKENDLKLVKRTVAFVLADTPRKVLEMAELDYDKIKEIKIVFQRHGVVEASQLVTQDLIDEAAIFGASRQICEAFAAFEKFGVHEAVFGPPYGVDPEKALVELAQTWRELS